MCPEHSGGYVSGARAGKITGIGWWKSSDDSIMGMIYNHKGQADHQRTSIPHTDSQHAQRSSFRLG